MLRRSVRIICILGSCFILSAQIPAWAQWQKPLQPSWSGGTFTCLASHPLDPAKFLLASERSIFEGGKENSWKELWSQTEASALIEKIFSFKALPYFVFALANDKVFVGDLRDLSWRKIYEHSERRPLSFAVDPQDPDRWFLGTQKGLWETEDEGKTWSPSEIFRLSSPVPLLVPDEARLFIAAENVLYLSLAGRPAECVFSMPAGENDLLENELLEDETDVSSYLFKIHDLAVSKDPRPALFLATRNGVFQSLDHGHRWAPLPKSGLQSPEVLQLAYSDRLYAATSRGVYAYDVQRSRWSGLFEGLAQDYVQGIAVLNDEKLIAITEEGFVESPLELWGPEIQSAVKICQPPEKTLVLLKDLFSMEPSAREVQKHVIRYANVSNGKIKRWHAASRVAGMLPTLSFGKDYSTGTSIDLDRGSTTDADRYILGPEDRSKGWNADISWHLGDAVYSSDQTSIDSREKLMVELRNDLLSEATRIYYERRRLQISLVFSPPVSEQEFLEALVRMDELTTLLDGMTDGFFSKKLERVYNEKPELNQLWEFQRKDGG